MEVAKASTLQGPVKSHIWVMVATRIGYERGWLAERDDNR